MKIGKGSRVFWNYYHALNSTSGIRRRKEGVFYGLCRHTIKHWKKIGSKQMAWVHFDSNKNLSKVPMCEIGMMNPKKER